MTEVNDTTDGGTIVETGMSRGKMIAFGWTLIGLSGVGLYAVGRGAVKLGAKVVTSRKGD